MVLFGAQICRNLDVSSGKEWLETNGVGGFASSTITGMNTRRYHALLVAALPAPMRRIVMLSKLEETLLLDGTRIDLSTNRFPGTVHPRGYEYQTGFELNPWPIFSCEVEGVRIRKSVFMVHGDNTTVVAYNLSGVRGRKASIELRPLLGFRDYHALARANGSVSAAVQRREDWVILEPYPGLPRLCLRFSGGDLVPESDWYYNFEYDRERERGLDCQEDLFHPFTWRFDGGDGDFWVIASTSDEIPRGAAELSAAELERRENLGRGWESADPLVRNLLVAADAFLVKRAGGTSSVIAGYPWFTEWGRDLMVSLPGLTLVPKRFDEARSILLSFAGYCDHGILPNYFPDGNDRPEYNTADATLWFMHALQEYSRSSGDLELAGRELYPVLLEILECHLQGTRYGIHADGDGLLAWDEPGMALTWMDARVGDWVVTPRRGRPVEIQALWYNALRFLAEVAARVGDQATARRCEQVADRARRSFARLFWNAGAGCLYDGVAPEGPDPSIRPNQVFALALPYALLSRERGKQVLETVHKELWTPLGLRTLAPSDPRYRGSYEGNVTERDSAYHQGTVWAWLTGPYLSARLRVFGNSEETRSIARENLGALRAHMSDAGLGSISEIFDGDAPHRPRGCIAQAWSVAETLRMAALFQSL